MGGKSLLQCRADLRLDLKDSGALWSDAELNRCIERATADLSRFLPDEKIYEDSLQFAVADESVTFPKDTSLDAVVADDVPLTVDVDARVRRLHVFPAARSGVPGGIEARQMVVGDVPVPGILTTGVDAVHHVVNLALANDEALRAAGL